jgi:predicted O-linked N-acetylglucosamine transferase (SPINDLY family)
LNLENSSDENSLNFEKARRHFLSGLEHILRESWIEAERELQVSLTYLPDRLSTLTNLSAVLIKLERLEEARVMLDRAFRLDSPNCELELNRGLLSSKERKYEEALGSYERSIELKPDYADAWNNRGIVLNDLKRHKEALASYARSIELRPDSAETWSNHGNALRNLRRYEEALASYERSIELKPDADHIIGDLVHTQMAICDWTDLDGRRQTLERRLLAGDRASSPFAVLGLFDDPKIQMRCAELYAKSKFSFESPLGPIAKWGRRAKIRVGYFSMDFREHPVAYLIAELIETHDRDKFEIFGFSFGASFEDFMRRRLEVAFDRFIEVGHRNELDIAHLSRELEIDIAIDLGGYTQDSRTAIFAHRAAPIQINYLGFPGTMGTAHFDYFIGDRIAVTENNLECFSEKVIFLPNSFQASSSQRHSSQRHVELEAPSRASCNLPESGFVFCCFNNSWKLTPELFRIWVRILKGVEDSVLWLYVDSMPARHRLGEAFRELGLDKNRLVFSPRVSREIYLGHYALADLFLDTLPYNAGSTASDALWMGLPVLTLAGKSFAGRMAASLLHAIELPELITHSAEEYESLAIELANSPEKIVSLKARLAENRASCPLFNTPLFTQHIESAYRAAYKRYHSGLVPEHIYVS